MKCPVHSWWPFTKRNEELKITFMSLLPNMAHAYPPVLARDIKPGWIDASMKLQETRSTEYSTRHRGTMTGTHKCSGIASFIQKGWILTSWHDFVIETNGDGMSFRARYPIPNLPLFGEHAIGQFSPDVYADFPQTGLPPNTLKTVLKVHIPWLFDAPAGWGLLMCPLEYIKEDRFTSATGILNPRITQQLHPILYWHVLKGQTLIKAGTPLCRLIPIRVDDNWKTEIRDITTEERDFYESHRLYSNLHYQRKHGLLSKIYNSVKSK